MVFRVVIAIYFYLEPTVRKDTWMTMASVTVMETFFESYLITAMFKVPFQEIQGTLTTAF